MILMNQKIVPVGELLRDVDPWIIVRHFHSLVQAGFDAGANITVIMDEQDLSAIMADQLASLLGNGIRHDDDSPVTFDSTD